MSTEKCFYPRPKQAELSSLPMFHTAVIITWGNLALTYATLRILLPLSCVTCTDNTSPITVFPNTGDINHLHERSVKHFVETALRGKCCLHVE